MWKLNKTICAEACALLAILAIFSGCGRDPDNSGIVGNQPPSAETGKTNGAVRVQVTREQVTRFGIMIAPATTGTLVRTLRVPGEIKMDADRVARVVPTAPGIVRQVVKALGASVQKGDILAWIESAELASAKSAYRAAVKTYAGEARLRESGINSVQDLLMAETAFVKAQATLHALLGTASRLDDLPAYGKAVQGPQTNELNESAAETYLQELSSDERFAWYSLTAPLTGNVVERNIAQGEYVDTSAKPFVIADLSIVWAEFAINQDSIADVRTGQAMTIGLHDGATHETTVQYVSPVVDPETRTVIVRATLNNEGGRFRPGSFIEGLIQIPSDRDAVLIPKDAVQLVYDHACVFVWNEGAFELREVRTGTTDGRQVEILRGLQAGERVAAVNAFHLKAEIIKSAAGDMGAGHGHAH